MAARRRKTLSHSDIENFLSEISTNTSHASTSKPEAAVVKPSRQQIEEDAAPAQVLAPLAAAIAVAAPGQDEDQLLIRKFCKLVMRGTSREADFPDEEIKDLASGVLDRTKYKLISTHFMSDEAPKHPSGSTEAKRALLLSLSPMLTEAEEERKRDTQACEEFTRCKFNKVRSHSYTYEYLDLDTGHKVDYPEYENRYLLYINRNKAPPQIQSTIIPPLLPEPPAEPLVMDISPPCPAPEELPSRGPQFSSPLLAVETVGAFCPVPEDVPIHHISPKYSSKKCSHNDRKRKHEHNDQGARRGTLSPGSMKAILLANLKSPPMDDQSVAVLTAITHTVQQGSQDLSIGAVSEESSDYMDCDLSVSFSKAKTSKRKGKRRHTLSPSGLVDLARRPSLLLNALEAGLDLSPPSLETSSHHEGEENVIMVPSPSSSSQGSADESSDLIMADASPFVPATPIATTLPAAEALFQHLDESDEAMELDSSLRSRAHSIGSAATKSSPTYALVLSNEPLPISDLDADSNANHLLHSISPDGLVSADDDNDDRELLDLEFTEELEEILHERAESPVQRLFASATDENGNSDVESDEETEATASQLLVDEDRSSASDEEVEIACDSAQEMTKAADAVELTSDEVVEHAGHEILETAIEALTNLASSSACESEELPEGTDGSASEPSTIAEKDVDNGADREGDAAGIELDSIRVPPLTPLAPAQSYSRNSSPNVPSPFTSFFGQRSALQTLIQEALQIMLPYHQDPNSSAHSAAIVEDDLRTFQLIEELVWKHVESEMQSTSGGSANFLRGISVVSQSSESSEMDVPVTLPSSTLLATTALQCGAGAIDTSADTPLAWDPADIPTEMDETSAETRAHKKLRERMAEVRSRYLWEVVSVQTANASIRRAQRLLASTMP